MGYEKMNKKAEFLARHYMILLILFGMVVGIGALMVYGMANSDEGYGIENMTDERYSDNYDTISDASSRIYQMSDETAKREGLTIWSVFTTIFSATFTIISLILGSFGIVNSSVSNLLSDAGVPSAMANIVGGGIVVIIIGIVVFIIISSVSDGKI